MGIVDIDDSLGANALNLAICSSLQTLILRHSRRMLEGRMLSGVSALNSAPQSGLVSKYAA